MDDLQETESPDDAAWSAGWLACSTAITGGTLARDLGRAYCNASADVNPRRRGAFAAGWLACCETKAAQGAFAPAT